MSAIVYWMTPIGWFHLLTFGITIPVLAAMQRRRMVAYTAGGGRFGDRLPNYRVTVGIGTVHDGDSTSKAIGEECGKYSYRAPPLR